MIDINKAQHFANALTDLCREHGVMIWTGSRTSPIMLTAIGEDTTVSYITERPEVGNSAILHRLLGNGT